METIGIIGLCLFALLVVGGIGYYYYKKSGQCSDPCCGTWTDGTTTVVTSNANGIYSLVNPNVPNSKIVVAFTAATPGAADTVASVANLRQIVPSVQDPSGSVIGTLDISTNLLMLSGMNLRPSIIALPPIPVTLKRKSC
jgi:hypothetical protein